MTLIRHLCLMVCLAIAAPATAAAPREISVRVTPLGKATAGKPLRVLVGIKNVGRSRLLFAGPETPGLTVHWFTYSFHSDAPGREMGGAGGVLKGTLHNPEGVVCPRLQDVQGLAAGAEMFRAAEIKLPDDVPAGAATIRVTVRLAKVRDDLECAPPILVEAGGRTLVTVRPSGVVVEAATGKRGVLAARSAATDGEKQTPT
jgi:hypothetical protein